MSLFTGSDKAIAFLFDIVANIANDYDETVVYTQGDYAIHEGVLYKCTYSMAVAEAFTPAHWAAVLIMEEVAAGGGGGSSTLAGLSDVDILAPSNGQTLVYDSANSKWKNGSGGGGGSYNETVIWSGTKSTSAWATPIEIQCNASDFDAFVLDVTNRSGGSTPVFVVKGDVFTSTAGSGTKQFYICSHTNGVPSLDKALWICCTSSAFYVYTYTGITVTVSQLIGMKF